MLRNKNHFIFLNMYILILTTINRHLSIKKEKNTRRSTIIYFTYTIFL